MEKSNRHFFKVRRRPFAAGLQSILILLLPVGFILIAQQASQRLYQTGFMVLVIATLIQIVFGNVPPSSNFKQSMKFLALGFAIVLLVCTIGILLAPYLINLGR